MLFFKKLFLLFPVTTAILCAWRGCDGCVFTSYRRRLHDQESPFALHDRLHPARSQVEAALGQVGVDKLVNPVNRHNTYRDLKDPR